MFDEALTPQQLIVIDALSDGANSTDAASQAGVHRNTIANWRRNSLFFRESLADAQYDRALLFRDKTEHRLDLALETLDGVLSDPKASASARLKAALFVIGVACTPPGTRKQVPFDMAELRVSHEQTAPPVHNNAQNAQTPTPLGHAAIAASAGPPRPPESDTAQTTSENPPSVHNNAQNAQSPIRREGPKVGRNAPCPCGVPSGPGRKFKYCCLNRPQATTRAAAA